MYTHTHTQFRAPGGEFAIQLAIEKDTKETVFEGKLSKLDGKKVLSFLVALVY